MHPFEALSVQALRLAPKAFDNPHRELDVPVAIGVPQSHEVPAGSDLHAQLLAKLASESIGFRLVGVDLAARKLPVPGHVLTRGTLCDEHAAVAVVESGR